MLEQPKNFISTCNTIQVILNSMHLSLSNNLHLFVEKQVLMCLVTKMHKFHGPSHIFNEGLTMPLGAYCEFMTCKATKRWRRMVI